MATTSIWHVKGNLSGILAYAANPEKIDNLAFYEPSDISSTDTQELQDLFAYATNPSKTERKLFVSGINCDPASAHNEMLAVKRGFSKTGGIVAWHGYQSFKPGEVDPDTAHEIGVKLADTVFGSCYQVVVATHLDKRHLHNHLIVNSVSFVDGKRYHRAKRDYQELRNVSDALCREYGLSLIEKPMSGKTKHYSEWQAEQAGKTTWRQVVKADVDECIKRAKTERQFFENLKTLGYEYKLGKDISVKPPGKERFFRLARNLGENYTLDAIVGRMHSGAKQNQVLPVPKSRRPGFVPPKKLPRVARGSIIALHRHYLYLLGYYQQRGSPGTNARMHYLLREDIRKLDDYIADTRLLGRNNIETNKQLEQFQDKARTKITELTSGRKQLKKQIRAVAGSGNSYTTKDNLNYQELNRQIKELRQEVSQCNRIAERSRLLIERIKRIEQDEERKLKTENRLEVTRGPNRTSRRPDFKDSAYRS